uniref:Uncharacterized protein n=1 Tax=Arundo donax TaxID=35708 RepID=A0A0A9CLV8_ARUDO
MKLAQQPDLTMSHFQGTSEAEKQQYLVMMLQCHRSEPEDCQTQNYYID